MGVRLKEDIRQCLLINSLPKEIKNERIQQTNVDNTKVKDEKEKIKKNVYHNKFIAGSCKR